MEIRLTQTVQNGGCAAKVSASDLRSILARVQMPPRDAKLLIDGSTFDDAAIYQIDDEKALVQTIDFFTPIVDTPQQFGKVAAANALSDVYAMGGKPLTALAVLAFPIATLPSEIASEVIQGAVEVLKKARTPLVGGHSITDDSIKFGLSVTGLVSPKHIWSNQGAKPGDQLILTKALGTGTCTAALKQSLVSEKDIFNVIESMSTLNNAIDFLSEDQITAIHAATDITGFGLTGHSQQMAKASQVSFVFDSKSLPYFEQAPEFLKKGILTRAHKTNRSYTEANTSFAILEAWQQLLVNDPQTSGGLLLSVNETEATSVLRTLQTHFPQTKHVGYVENSSEGQALLRFQ